MFSQLLETARRLRKTSGGYSADFDRDLSIKHDFVRIEAMGPMAATLGYGGKHGLEHDTL